MIGWLLACIKEPEPMHLVCRRVGVQVSDKIFDVGVGAGAIVLSLLRLGFKRVMSVDPYIADDIFKR